MAYDDVANGNHLEPYTAASLSIQHEIQITEYVQKLPIRDAKAMLGEASAEIGKHDSQIKKLARLKQIIKRELLGE